MRAKPTSVKEFLREPTRTEWDAALADGWPGPNGSTASTDSIGAVRIGITSPDFQYSHLPANIHDWLYYLGRKHRLSEKFRKAADVVYRDRCLARVRRLTGISGQFARWRCRFRYSVLRRVGTAAWTVGDTNTLLK